MRAAVAPGRSSSKALPIAVAAGLAVGVFAGLLVLKGTGSDKKADKVAASDEGGDESGESDKPTAEKGDKADKKPAVDPEAAKKAAAKKAAAEKAAAEKAAAEKAAAAKAALSAEVELTIQVDPEDADIYVNGDKIDGKVAKAKLDNGKASIKVAAKKSGYKSVYKKVDLTGNDTLEIKMHKRRRSSGHKKKRRGASDLIDL